MKNFIICNGVAKKVDLLMLIEVVVNIVFWCISLNNMGIKLQKNQKKRANKYQKYKVS